MIFWDFFLNFHFLRNHDFRSKNPVSFSFIKTLYPKTQVFVQNPGFSDKIHQKFPDFFGIFWNALWKIHFLRNLIILCKNPVAGSWYWRVIHSFLMLKFQHFNWNYFMLQIHKLKIIEFNYQTSKTPRIWTFHFWKSEKVFRIYPILVSQ